MPPGRFNFHIRVWCQTVGDSPRKGDHAGASPVTLTILRCRLTAGQRALNPWMEVRERSSATGAPQVQPGGPSAKSASQSCHPDHFFRCGVTAAQRPLKPSGVGAEPAAGAKFRVALQDRAPPAQAVRRKFATSKQPIGRARVRHAARQHHTVDATQNSPRVVLPGWRAR